MSNETNAHGRPTHGARTNGRCASNRDWWPKQLNQSIQHQHGPRSNPLGADFRYACRGFRKLDLAAVIGTCSAVMTTPRTGGPRLCPTGGLFIPTGLATSAGTYRVADGPGGAATANQRFAPV